MRSRINLRAATLGACLMAASPVLADDGTEPSQTETRINTDLLLSGAITFGVGYGAAAIAASRSDREGMDRLYVPLVGPWLALNDRADCPVLDNDCDRETTTKVLVVGDGIVQAAGAVVMLDALLFPETVRRSPVVSTLRRIKPIRVGTGGSGLAFSTTF